MGELGLLKRGGCESRPRYTGRVNSGPPARQGGAAGQLTSNEHQDDREDLLVVSVRGYVAKADGYEPGETKVEGGTVPALKMGLQLVTEVRIYKKENKKVRKKRKKTLPQPRKRPRKKVLLSF